MWESTLIAELPRRLSELAGLPVAKPRAEGPQHPYVKSREVDALVETPPFTWLIECKSPGHAAAVDSAIRRLEGRRQHLRGKHALPLVAVPFMGESGKRLCEEHGVSWMDLAGNAHLRAPGLHIHIEGRPNRLKKVGRPENPFAPRSARIARRLLLEPQHFLSQRELARLTGLGEGYVSRIVRKLEAEELLQRDEQGRVQPRAPELLLESWHERYDFQKHQILKGHVPARSAELLLRSLSARLSEAGVGHAATGLAAAWKLTHFSAFRMVTLYVQRLPFDVLESLSFREEARGANVWIVLPNDAGVFDGTEFREGVRCVSPVQVYLDLKAQPERSEEAAVSLRDEYLMWGQHG
jgi:hypothetical protein